MSVETVTGAAGAASSPLPAGTVVGGRFVVEKPVTEDALGAVLAARDNKTNKAIALRLMKKGLLDGEGKKRLRDTCRVAATIAHRNVVRTYGVGNDPQGGLFVASEWVDGKSLSEVVAGRRARGKHMSLKGAYNVIANVTKALSKAHEKAPHGALRPSVVRVSSSGRVKVGDFGVGRAVVETAGAAALGEHEQACLAPEVKAGQPPTAASDIFGLGAILYELLTNMSPAEGWVPPSQAHPEASEDIDAVLLKCLAADPDARYASPEEVRAALMPFVGGLSESEVTADDEDLDLSVDIDLDIDGDGEAEGPALAAPPAAPKAPATVQAKLRAAIQDSPRVSPAVIQAPGLPPPPKRAPEPEPVAPPMEMAPGGRASEVDFTALLAKVTKNDAPRWMVSKEGLDHGPFTARELVEQIVRDEVHDSHIVLNMDNGQRRPVLEWPDFAEFLEQQKVTRRHKQQQAQLAQVQVKEKRSGAFKVMVALGIVAALGAGGAIFAMTRQAGAGEQVAEAELGNLYETGEIAIEGSSGILPDPPRSSGGRRGGRRSGGGGGGGGGLSYEEAMNQAVELGNAAQGGGESRLSPAQVTGVMNRHVNRIFRECAVPEISRSGNLGMVTIDLAIMGDGSVMGASVSPGSGTFQGCVQGAVRGIRFPTFAAPRMGARYRFSAD